MAFKKTKITSRLVDALKLGETVMDTEVPGYMVRRQRGEARIYSVRKSVGGTRHFVTIGEDGREGWTETKARAEALLIIAALRKGAKARGMPQLAEWAEKVLEARINEVGIKPGTARNYRSFIKTHIAPRDKTGALHPHCLGKLRIDQISESHIGALHQKLRSTPRVANQVLTLLAVMFGEAARQIVASKRGQPSKRCEAFPRAPA